MNFFDALGHRIDADRSGLANFTLRGSSPEAEPEDLRRRIGEGLRMIREWLESQPEVVKNREGDEFRTAEVLDRVRALQEHVGSDVPFHELVPAMVKEFAPDNRVEPDALSICKVTCKCRKK